ncbi:MAG: oxidoreductase, partial [Psychromonas sp.]
TVMPFILRGVKLLGIDSVNCPYERRLAAWKRLSEIMPASYYQQACREIDLTEAVEYAQAITNGQVTGRTVIKL